MKAMDFRQLLLDAQQFKGRDSPQALGELAKIFADVPTSTVADIVKRLDNMEMPPAAFLAAKSHSARDQVLALHHLMVGRAKDAVVKDIQLLANLIGQHSSASLDTFVTAAIARLATKPQQAKKALRADLVEQYNRRLEEALGNDKGFHRVFDELVANPEIRPQEATALAKKFALVAPRSKQTAFKKILGRHEALMTSRARSLATAGRVAG